MSFLRIDDSHMAVPGKMDADEMAFLAALAAGVPEGGHIVEIGPFYGRSTRVMAQANPGARITSIDTFEDVEWTRRYAARHRAIPAFGVEAFRHFTHDLPNVTALTGPSPEVAAGWEGPVDLYFEDAVHGNPVLARNIAFWTDRLRPGGIACGHDYTLRFPDIKREVDRLAEAWTCKVALVGSLWALRKPDGQSGAPLSPRLSDQPCLKLRAKTKRKGLHAAMDGYWCGAHLEADRMLWFHLSEPRLPPGLHLEARVAHPDFGQSPWLRAGTRVFLPDDTGRPRPFDRIALRLTGPNPAGLRVGYRVSARQIGKGGGARSGTSDLAFDGEWARARGTGLAINALSVALHDIPPAGSQAAFPAQDLPQRGRAALHGWVHRWLGPARDALASRRAAR